VCSCASLSSPANDSVGTAPYVACRGNAAITGGSHGADTIVGGIIIDIRPEPVPFGGPWLSDIWRRPGHSHRGLGTWLISRAMRLLHDDGLHTLGLSVTHGNPARRIYGQLGFAEQLESWTLRIPE